MTGTSAWPRGGDDDDRYHDRAPDGRRAILLETGLDGCEARLPQYVKAIGRVLRPVIPSLTRMHLGFVTYPAAPRITRNGTDGRGA